jgi:CRP/FNR family cyclic AMP-dependent transcriptional regulator
MAADPIMLAEVPIFSLLDQDERQTLVEFLERRQLKAGELIFRTGDHADALYVVAEGKVEMFVNDDGGHKITIQELGPSDVVGEVSFMDGGPRTASAVALEPTSLFRFERESLLTFVTRHPHAALDMLGILGKRLRLSDELLRHTVVQNANIVEESRMTFGERIADRVATFGGSWTFIILFGGVLLVWIVANVLLLMKPFDPYPFIFLNLVLSMLAAIQAPVIMMSQNRQSAKDRLNSDLDFKVNQKAEMEISQLHKKIDQLYEVVQEHWAEREQEHRAGAQGKPANDYY